MEAYFVFKGIDSRQYNILISAMPEPVKPGKKGKLVEIPGRNGSLYQDEGVYEEYTLSIECGARDMKDVAVLGAWLDGAGELILSTEPDKLYRARVVNKIAFSNMIQLYGSFMVLFDVYPLKYSVNSADDLVVLEAPGEIYNPGTYYSEPVIHVYGAGNIKLILNGDEFGLAGVEGHVTLNSEIMECYKGNVNCNAKLSAQNFPILKVGRNVLEFSGDVHRVEIEPNWRWI